MKAKHKLSGQSIGAPSIRAMRGEVEIDEHRVEIDPVNGRVTGRLSGHVSGLRRYRVRGEITARQFDAGQRFIDQHEAAHAAGIQAQDLGGIGAATPDHGGRVVSKLIAAEQAIAAQRDLKRAIAKLGPCYPLISAVLLTQTTPREWAERRGWRPDHGFGILLLGLDALADHYAIY
jgi:hypothetical protein